MTLTDFQQGVGPRFDCGIVSPTHGDMGMFLKPSSYQPQQQLVQKQDVVAAVQQALSDRDLSFWTRETQSDWSGGEGQAVFDDASRYREAYQIEVANIGQISLTDKPRQLATTNTAMSARGGVVAGGYIFFGWESATYLYQAWNTLESAWGTKTLPAGVTSDVCTDGTTVYFCGSYNGVWKTASSVPANATQYDSGGTGPYTRIIYDPLRKAVYGITTAALHKINSGGAPTVIFDFVTGVLTSLEYHDGQIVVSWNSYNPTNSSQIGLQDCTIYAYDGTNMLIFADVGDGSAIGAMKSHLGSLYFVTYTINFNRQTVTGGTAPGAPEVMISAYAVIGDTLTLLGYLGVNVYPDLIYASGPYIYFDGITHLWKYDTRTGGLSRVMGDQTTASATFGTIRGLVSVWDAQTSTLGPTLIALTKTAGGKVWSLSDSVQGSLSAQTGARQLTSSRMDKHLPYVDAYWDSFEVNLNPLVSGESFSMEFSIDDGATWTSCPSTTTRPNPVVATGTQRALMNVLEVNPHIMYRVTLVAKTGGHGPTILSVSPRFVPSNPQLKVYKFTTAAMDSIRGRGGVIEDTYAQDIIDYLYAIAQTNEVVTFYEPNDPLRTPHSCWVMSVNQMTANTGGTFSPLRAEGEVDVVLWETGS